MQFTFNGINNTEMGVIVSKRPPLKTPQQRMSYFNVDGTYGTTSQFQGYEPVSNEMEVIVESEDYLDAVKGWLTGKGVFTRSDRPNMTQEVWFIGVMEFTRLPNSIIYTGTLKWTSYYPIWSLEEGEVPLNSRGHNGTSWNYAYEITNSGTTTTYPTLVFNNAQTGDIRIGYETIQINRTAARIEINTYTGEIMVDGQRDDSAVTFLGQVKLEPGTTVIYSDNNLSNFKVINPSSYL